MGHDQLLAIGFTSDAIRYRLKGRRIRRIHPAVYAVGSQALTQRGRWFAALLATRPSPFLSHLSSAAADGLAREATGIHITTTSRSRRRLNGVTVHRCRHIDPLDVTRTEDGLPITTLSRTILDLAEILSYDRVEKVVEEADRREILDLEALGACMRRNPGRHGLAPLAKLLGVYLPVDGAEEGLERPFQLFLAEEGFPAASKNVLVAGQLVDCFWPEHNLVVELDSRGFHKHWRQAERDRARDGGLLRSGVRHLRVTDRRLQRERGELIADLASVLPRS